MSKLTIFQILIGAFLTGASFAAGDQLMALLWFIATQLIYISAKFEERNAN